MCLEEGGTNNKRLGGRLWGDVCRECLGHRCEDVHVRMTNVMDVRVEYRKAMRV